MKTSASVATFVAAVCVAPLFMTCFSVKTQEEADVLECSRENPMCIFDDKFDGCEEGCEPYCGQEYCTCDIFTTNVIRRTTNLSNSGQKGDPDPWQCARQCELDDSCNIAFFSHWVGKCTLMKACGKRWKVWVGDPKGNRWGLKAGRQGGTQFAKWKRQLLLPAQQNSWPSMYFGSYAGLNTANFSKDSWDALKGFCPSFPTSGVTQGYDWSLPATAQASSMGKIANVRTFSLGPWWLNKIENAPYIPGIHQTVEIWFNWREVEKEDGEFDFTQLDAFVKKAKTKEFTVYLRLMTSDKTRAPDYFKKEPLKTIIGDAPVDSVPFATGPCPSSRGHPWNIEHPEFHKRYKRLVKKMGRYCRDPAVTAMFVGWMSCSNGDEGIGPAEHGYDGHHEKEPDIVRERLNFWNAACQGNQHKVVMAGKSAYGQSLGFGFREGFIEMYWYRQPETYYASYEGHRLNKATGHIEIDETNTLANGQATNGDENEEYGPEWSSEWRCAKCGEAFHPGGMGGFPYNASFPELGNNSRFGPIGSYPYRYMMSMLRSLHLRSTLLVVDPESIVNVPLSRYVSYSLGHNLQTTSDAWCFLVQAETDYGKVSNWERWLTQRDSTHVSVNSGEPASPDAEFYSTPFNAAAKPVLKAAGGTEFIAKAATELAFAMAEPFQKRLNQAEHAYVKVSFFHVGSARKILLLQGGATAAGVKTCTSTELDSVDLGTATGAVRTATFSIAQASTFGDFCVAGRDGAGNPKELVASLVRVIIVPKQ